MSENNCKDQSPVTVCFYYTTECWESAEDGTSNHPPSSYRYIEFPSDATVEDLLYQFQLRFPKMDSFKDLYLNVSAKSLGGGLYDRSRRLFPTVGEKFTGNFMDPSSPLLPGECTVNMSAKLRGGKSKNGRYRRKNGLYVPLPGWEQCEDGHGRPYYRTLDGVEMTYAGKWMSERLAYHELTEDWRVFLDQGGNETRNDDGWRLWTNARGERLYMPY